MSYMHRSKRIAMLMLCHTLPEQINAFISCFDSEKFEFFLHFDKKSTIQREIVKKQNVHFVPDERRVAVRWGTFSLVQATLELITLSRNTGRFDYFWLCSGQDFPIKTSSYISDFFAANENNYISFVASKNNSINEKRGTTFDKRCDIYFPLWMIRRTLFARIMKNSYIFLTGGSQHTFPIFRRTSPKGLKLYFGSQWWCLSRTSVEWILDYIRTHEEVCTFYKNTLCPDESFFHTLIMNSPFKNDIEPSLIYVKWLDNKSSPKILDEDDYSSLVVSDKLLARKINSRVSPALYKKLVSGYGDLT